MEIEYIPPQKPSLPNPPSLMSVGLPSTYVSPVNPNTGFVDRIIEKWKASDVSNIVENQRKASDNMLVIAKNNAEAMKIAMTFSSEVEMVFARHAHERNMFMYAEQREQKDIEYREKEIELLKNQVQTVQLDNQIKYWNGKEAEISYEITCMDRDARKRAMEE